MSDNRRIEIIVILALVMFATMILRAEPSKLFEEKGCIWRTDDQGQKVQLTTNGKDRSPVLSPDGNAMVFLRKSTKNALLVIGAETDYPGDSRLADQVWLLDLKTRKERLLIADNSCDGKLATENCQKMIAFIDNDLCFSLDGDRLYFITSAWVVSGALHFVDIKTGKDSFLMEANSVEVVMQGKYRGYLIVLQHRYFLGKGSYDMFWLFSPEGKEIGPVGDTQEQIDAFKHIYATATPLEVNNER